MKKAVEGWRKFYKNQCGKASKGLRVWWVVFRRGSEWVEHWGGGVGGDFKPTHGSGLAWTRKNNGTEVLVTSGANRYLVGPAPSFVSFCKCKGDVGGG